MGVQYDAKDLATLVISLMKVLSQKLDECSVCFQVGVRKSQPSSTYGKLTVDVMVSSVSADH